MQRLQPYQKYAGLLVPVFAMRHSSDFGIGDPLAVRDAIDFCAKHGFSVLQILPIHETVGDYSPYNPISSRALSPSLLALTPDEVPGLTKVTLDEAAPASLLGQLRAGGVKHAAVQSLKLKVLLAAHSAFRTEEKFLTTLAREFETFARRETNWLSAYTLFRVLIHEYAGNPNWSEWRPEHQTLACAEAWAAVHPERERLMKERDGFAFIQWVGWRQWSRVRSHAEAKGVWLMGEMSFGVGRCSADVWSQPELFEVDWNMGTRPITYFDTNKDSELWGQNWGLPPYRWDNHRMTDFAWLRARVAGEREFFHICRLDHLRGYFRAYMFPWQGGATHAEFAKLTIEEARLKAGGRLPRFVPGPDEDPLAERLNEAQGRGVIAVIQAAAGDMYLFAEIMGAMPEYMKRALDDLSMPNLTFPQLERKADRSLFPKDAFRVLSLATYANHDHAPLAAFYQHLFEEARTLPESNAATDLRNLLKFAGWDGPAPEHLTDKLLAALQRALFETPCQLAVLLSSDLLGTTQRFNLPGNYGPNTWNERLELPFGDYDTEPVYARRIAAATSLIAETKRAPRGFAATRPAARSVIQTSTTP